MIEPGPFGVSPGSLSDQREWLSNIWRHATCCSMRGSSHQRQNWLRTHDFCRQGVCDTRTQFFLLESIHHYLTLQLWLLLTALCTCRQTWETSSVDSGAHQWRQSESYHRRGRPTLQTLPAADGSAFQTGSLISLFYMGRESVCFNYQKVSFMLYLKTHNVLA